MERRPVGGELYRHFKNELYQVITVAVHMETGEELVICQALSGDYRVYAEPLPVFLEETDRTKYPEATQKYRFERVERPQQGAEPGEAGEGGQSVEVRKEAGNTRTICVPDGSTGDAELRKTDEDAQSDRRREEGEEAVEQEQGPDAQDGVSPKLMAFFDADDLEQKYQILLSMREEMTDHLINNMAVVLDIVIPEGDTDSRYEELKRCIRTKQRYESDRLR